MAARSRSPHAATTTPAVANADAVGAGPVVVDPALGDLPPRIEQGVLSADGEEWREVGYSGPTACAVVGISYRQLDYWARTGLLSPSLAKAAGSGTQRRYAYRDLVALKVIKSLIDGGVSLQTARKAIDYFRDHLGEDLASASLVIEGANTVLARTGDDLVDLVRRGQVVLNIVPLGGLVDSLAASIHELHAEPLGPKDGAAHPVRRAQD